MTCPVCGKVAHTTRGRAWAHARALAAERGATFDDLSVYRCKGGGWHVGHSVVKFSKRIRESLRGGKSAKSTYRRRAK